MKPGHAEMSDAPERRRLGIKEQSLDLFEREPEPSSRRDFLREGALKCLGYPVEESGTEKKGR